jgi:hypothetical protein
MRFMVFAMLTILIAMLIGKYQGDESITHTSLKVMFPAMGQDVATLPKTGLKMRRKKNKDGGVTIRQRAGRSLMEHFQYLSCLRPWSCACVQHLLHPKRRQGVKQHCQDTA